MKVLSLVICCLCIMVSPIFFSACNFAVNYKETSQKLNELVTHLTTNSQFTSGVITVNSKSYAGNLMPVRETRFKEDTENYVEINQIYDTVFSYVVDYIKDNAELFKTPPTVESLTEAQEGMYSNLHRQIDLFNSEIDTFSRVIKDVNNYYAEQENQGQSSKAIYTLNYKQAYAKLISQSFNVANALEDITASVYTEIDYNEFANKKGDAFKSLEHGILIRVFEGYFTFLVDSFGYRVPTLNVDANAYMKEVMGLYNSARSSYLSLYQSMKGRVAGTVPQFTQVEIDSIKLYMQTYFAETELYKTAYNNLNFVNFYFNDDCDLDKYIASNSANQNYYNKICDYLGNVLPNLTQYISAKFFA